MMEVNRNDTLIGFQIHFFGYWVGSIAIYMHVQPLFFVGVCVYYLPINYRNLVLFLKC